MAWSRTKGNAVSGATVSLLRFYGKDLALKATNITGADGSFGFPDIWYGPYDIRAVYADQSVELPLVLNVGRIPVVLTLLRDVPLVTPGPTITPLPTNATATPSPRPTVTVTPRPPTPTPPPVTLSYLISSYGIAIAVMMLIAAALFLIALRMKPK